MNISVVRPLVDKLYELDDVSISKSRNHLAMSNRSSSFPFPSYLDLLTNKKGRKEKKKQLHCIWKK